MTSECHDDTCITCSDQLLRLRVTAIDGERRTARGTVDGSPAEVNLDLVGAVQVGDTLLCHAGVALQREAAEAGA